MRQLLMKSLLLFFAGILVFAWLLLRHAPSKNSISFDRDGHHIDRDMFVGFMLPDEANEQDVTTCDRSSAGYQHTSKGSHFSSYAREGLYYSWEE